MLYLWCRSFIEVSYRGIEIYGVLLHINFLSFLLLLDRLQYVLYLTIDLLYPLSATIVLLNNGPFFFGFILAVSCLLRRDVVLRKVLVV